MTKTLTRFCQAFFVFCFVGFYASLTYFIYLSRHSSRSPTSATGQTFELNNHSDFFYVREWQYFLAQPFFPIGAMLLTVLLLRVRYGKAALEQLRPTKESRILNVVLGVVMLATIVYMFLPMR